MEAIWCTLLTKIQCSSSAPCEECQCIYGPLHAARVCLRGGTLVDYAKARAKVYPDQPGQPGLAAYPNALANNPTLQPRDFPGLDIQYAGKIEWWLQRAAKS